MLGKTWVENNLGLMHDGTSGALIGKLESAPDLSHLVFLPPASIGDLGRGRGVLQGGGSGCARVEEEGGGWKVLGEPCGMRFVEASITVVWLGLGGDLGLGSGACEERVIGALATAPLLYLPAAPLLDLPADSLLDLPAASLLDLPTAPSLGLPAAPSLGFPAAPLPELPVALLPDLPAALSPDLPVAPSLDLPAAPPLDLPAAPLLILPAAPSMDLPAVP